MKKKARKPNGSRGMVIEPLYERQTEHDWNGPNYVCTICEEPLWAIEDESTGWREYLYTDVRVRHYHYKCKEAI